MGFKYNPFIKNLDNTSVPFNIYELLAHKDQPLGYAGLDSMGKILTTELPASILGALSYKGVWDASGGVYPSNPMQGDYYVASVAGTIDGTSYEIGDWMVFNGVSWDKVISQQIVSSVNGKVGAVNLVKTDLPDLVPYIGATGAVNLGSNHLTAGILNTVATDPYDTNYQRAIHFDSYHTLPPTPGYDITNFVYTDTYTSINMGSRDIYSTIYQGILNGTTTVPQYFLQFYSRPYMQSSGAVANMVGFMTDPYFWTSNCTGAVTNVVGFWAFGGAYGGGATSTITNWYQVRISNPASGINKWGLYISNITGGTNNYAITTGLGKVLFGDTVQVTGTITASNLSGTNTGDQNLSGLVPKTTTVNGHALSSNVTVTAADVGAITDAPSDGTIYGRRNNTWAATGAGVSDHALLTHLDYASSGHTGFQSTLTPGVDYQTPLNTVEVYDDFNRPDTVGGDIGISTSGYTWRLTNYFGNPTTSTRITDDIWVHAEHETGYAWFDAQLPIRTMGGIFSFVEAGGSDTNSAINLSISLDGTTSKLLHLTVSPVAFDLAIYVDTPYSYTILVEESIPCPTDGNQHTIEFSVDGNWAHIIYDGIPYHIQDDRIAEFVNSKSGFFELANTNSGTAVNLGRFHRVWGGFHAGEAQEDIVKLPNTTSKYKGVIRMDDEPFVHAFTPDGSNGLNTFVGVNAGNWTMNKGVFPATRCSYNTIIGAEAFTHAVTAMQNTVVGAQALNHDTDGYFNTALGFQSLLTNTTGSGNTAIGMYSLYSNDTGSGNVAIGYYAGFYSTDSNSFYVDNQDRTNTAGDKAKALLYGTFAAAAANQQLTINADLTVSNLTGSKVLFTDANKKLTVTGIGTSSQFIKGDGSLDSTTYLVTETDPLSLHIAGHTLGDMFYGDVSGNVATLSGQITTTQKFLSQTGDGANSAAPSWQTIPVQGVLSYYLTNVNSAAPSGDFKQTTSQQTGKVELDYSGITSTPSVMKKWITDAGFPGLSFIPAGEFEVHVHLSNAGGGSMTAYGEIWEVDSAGNDIGLIVTSENTYVRTGAYITNTEREYRLYGSTGNPHTMSSSTSRLVLKLWGFGQSGTHQIEVYVGGTADAHINLPGPTVDASNFVPYIGATADVNLSSSYKITAQKFVTSGATSSQFVKGDGSLDSSTYLTTVTAHNILSATHGDTLADSVARGDILYGNVTPKWARLAFPASPTGKVLQATATDVAWSANPITIGASASVSGSNTGDQVVPATEGGAAHNFLTAYNATTGAWTKAQPAQADITGLTTADSPTFAGLTLTNILTTSAATFAITGTSFATITLNYTGDGNTSRSALALYRANAGGAGADGIGVHIDMLAETETEGTFENAARLTAKFNDATAGTVDGDFYIGVTANSVVDAYQWKFGSDTLLTTPGNITMPATSTITAATALTLSSTTINFGTAEVFNTSTGVCSIGPTLTTSLGIYRSNASVTMTYAATLNVGVLSGYGGAASFQAGGPSAYASYHTNTSGATTVALGGGSSVPYAMHAFGAILTPIWITTAGVVVGPVIRGRESLGTIATPTAIGANYPLLRITSSGYGDSAWKDDVAYFDLQSAEVFTNTTAATRAVIATTPTGSVTAAANFGVMPTGNVGINAAKQFNLDGYLCTGDTYIIESSANVLDFYAGGVNNLRLGAASYLKLAGTGAYIHSNTSSGSDNARIDIVASGETAFGASRGAGMFMFGKNAGTANYVGTVGIGAGVPGTTGTYDGMVIFYTGGATVQGAFNRTGDFGLVATHKIYLDGVVGAGDTYITESSANNVRVYVGGVALNISSPGAGKITLAAA